MAPIPKPWYSPSETLHHQLHIGCTLCVTRRSQLPSGLPGSHVENPEWDHSPRSHCSAVCLLHQGGETHHNNLVPYLLQLGTVTPKCSNQPFQARSPTGPGTWYPECWEVWNLIGGSEKAPAGLGSKCSMKDGFSLGCVTGLTLSPIILAVSR